MIRLLLLSIAGVAMWLGPVVAQERPIPLDSLIVEVNSRASPFVGAGTRAVEVIDSATIRNSPATSVVELLALTYGLESMPRSPALVDVAIRGSSFEQVLVLVDGVRVRDTQTGHFNLNLAVPLEQVQRIEILRGPAASLYGSDAMAGVINIVTRKGGASSSVRLSHGSFATTDVSAAARGPVGPVIMDAAVEYQTSDGHRPGTDFEIGQGRLALVVSLAGEPLRAEIGYATRDFGADGFYGPYPSFEATRTTTAAARWRLPLGSSVSIEPIVGYRRNSDDFILDRDDPSLSRNRHTTDQANGEIIARMDLTDRISVAGGLHARFEDIRSSALGKHSEWATAASLEAAAGRATDLAVTAGLRADRLPTGQGAVSPSVSVAWSPLPWLCVKSSGGRSFRAPTWTERFYPGPPSVGIGNPDLEPERAWNVDAGVELQKAAFRFITTVYTRRASGLIDWARPSTDPEGAWAARNVDSAEFTGLETEIDVYDVAGFRVRAGGHWLSLTSSSAAGWTSKYALRPRVENTSIAVERAYGILNGSVRVLRERRIGEAAHVLLDARLAADFGWLRLWGDLRNALDTEYQDISFNPAPGRSLTIGAEWRQSR